MKNDGIKIKKKTLLYTGAFLVIVLFLYIGSVSVQGYVSKGTTFTTTNSGDTQIVKVSFKNYAYVMEPSTVKKGVPVRMEFDLDTVVGCMRSVVISSFNVRKNLVIGDNTLEFTPNKSGTFWITCSMNMGRGQFTVEDSPGVKPVYVQEEPDVGSCGGASGGCSGCGN